MRFIISHPDLGIYLGSAFGSAFWSKLDHVGLQGAQTFANEAEAQAMVARITELAADLHREAFCFTLVKDDLHGFASIASIVAAGLPAWNPAEDVVA